MRTTAPSLRRRNYALRKSHRAWLARRDDDSDASGEESDDERGTGIVARPAGGFPVVSGGTAAGTPGGRFPVVSGGTGRVSGGGAAIVPESTIAAEEQELGSDGELTSAPDTDGFESGDESDSGNEQEVVTPPAVPPPPAVTPPVLAAPEAPGTTQLPPPEIVTTSTTATPAPVTTVAPPPPPPPPPTTTAATTSTAARLPPPVLAPVQTEAPLTTTSSKASTTTSVVALPVVTGTTTAFQTLVPPNQTSSSSASSGTPGTTSEAATQPVDTATGQAPLPTLDSPAADVTPPPTSSQEENVANPNDNAIGAVVDDRQGVNAGAAAGIVIGVLALIGIMVLGAFLWKKWRDNGKRLSGLPLFSNRSEKGSGPDMAYGGAVMERDTAAILSPPTFALSKKTNSEMMDDLMQATYKAEGGYTRDSKSEAGTFGNKAGNMTFGEKGGPGFMNESTYTALAGPPTPAAAPSGPVGNWLSGVKTPHQSGAPPIRDNWPVSEYGSGPPPAQPTPSLPKAGAPWQQGELPVGRPPMPDFLPPQPAFQRDPRYTTTTTTTSTDTTDVRWG
ncbi:hypothetical protein B0T16DRAFT_451863 [Cercophora newfieldiana]|uniref:Uncharacterized protein n=1 Tax=Cercophora newfieldiana TaxID=92897 RepID=A0AA40D0Y8_9PEZI|nr:hypothetical protein B0T16DRAFT_451863 [Cercophora newfieldiana]